MNILLLHFFFYCFLFYNVYVFVLLNILYYVGYCVSKHIDENKITKTDNIFLKPFISIDKNTSIYYVDIYLSKFTLYKTIKTHYYTIVNQFTEFADLALTATENNTRKSVMTAMAPKPQDIMQMLPMLLAQKKNVNYNKKQEFGNVPLNIPVKPNNNPLLYDSDIDEQLTVD